MYCCICKKTHSIDGLFHCDLFFTSAIIKYIIFKPNLLMDDIKKYRSRHSCDICNKIFKTITNYKYHISNNVCNKIKVSRKKEIKCDICEKIFTDKRSLIYHQNKVVCKKNQPEINNQTIISDIEINDISDMEIKNIIITTDNKTKGKYKKNTIPHSLKRVVWNYWIGDDYAKSQCLCCGLTTISQMNFCCGHVVAEINGGKLVPQNLKPICQSCNSSMGTSNMDEFILKYGLKQKNYNKINFNQYDDLTDLIKSITKKLSL